MIDTVPAHQPRCERPRRDGQLCRTPVAGAGYSCHAHSTPPPEMQAMIEAFVENYTCADCNADVQLSGAGVTQLIVVAHDSTCPTLAEHVQRRSAA
jgi:hypothetical protein